MKCPNCGNEDDFYQLSKESTVYCFSKCGDGYRWGLSYPLEEHSSSIVCDSCDEKLTVTDEIKQELKDSKWSPSENELDYILGLK